MSVHFLRRSNCRRWVRVFRQPGAKLTRMYYDLNSSSGKSSVIERRFGGWINAVRQVRSLLDPAADKELMDRISEYASPQVAAEAKSTSTNEETDGSPISAEDLKHELIESNGNLYGDYPGRFFGSSAQCFPKTSAFPKSQVGRLPRHPFRGLLSVHSHYGLHAH